MHGWNSALALSWMELKLFLREPFAVFFSLAFPLILLLFVGSIGGQDHLPDGGRFIDAYMATMAGVTAANVGLMGMSIHVAESRSQGVLKRYRLSPMPNWAYFFAQYVTAICVLGISILALAGITLSIYGPPQRSNWAGFLVLSLVALYVMMSLGLLLGGLPLPVRSVQVVSAGVFFLIFFASGSALPRESFPDWLRRLSDFNPLAILNEALIKAYTAAPVPWLSVSTLLALTVAVNLITLRLFDWEGNN